MAHKGNDKWWVLDDFPDPLTYAGSNQQEKSDLVGAKVA